MKVTLLTYPEAIKAMEDNAALAALTCHANTDKPYVAQEVLSRIIKLGHESVIEHINLTYSVKGLSRACLQELARHRFVSLSVESTRHTLRKRLEGDLYDLNAPMCFISESLIRFDLGGKLFQLPELFIEYLSRVNEQCPETPNDVLKYLLPEFWPTNLILTANIRELRHVMELRTAPAALNEFRVLACSMYEAVPDECKYLLSDCVYKEGGNE